MFRIAVRWSEYAPRVVTVHPELFAEMYGFIYATVELKLPFTLVKSIVVSVVTVSFWPIAAKDAESCCILTFSLCGLPVADSKS